VTETSISAGRTRESAIDPAVRKIAFTVVLGVLAVVFDTTIVSVALDDLTNELHASISTIQWVSTGYLLAMFVTIPISGWAQSVLGGKRLWVAALLVFLLGSVLCACSWNAASLIGFRVLQGIGGGIMMPLMMNLIMQAAGGRNLGTLMSVVTLPIAVGPILGPVLGGVILHVASWRWLFLVNIPFCVVGAYLAAHNLPDDKPAARTRLDRLGLLLLSPGVVGMIFGLSRVEDAGGFGQTQVLASFLLGFALVTVFVLRGPGPGAETRSSTSACSPTGRLPLQPPSAFSAARCSTARSCCYRCTGNSCVVRPRWTPGWCPSRKASGPSPHAGWPALSPTASALAGSPSPASPSPRSAPCRSASSPTTPATSW
jgi:MFS family permease